MTASNEHLPSYDGLSFVERVRAFGCTDVVDLSKDAAAPAQLEYVDLIPRRGNINPLPIPVEAVAEHQGTGLLYLVDGRRTQSSSRDAIISELQHQLANRSDPAYLGVVTGGSLDIFPIEFRKRDGKGGGPKLIQTVEQTQQSAPLFFQSLVQGTFGKHHLEPHGSDHVYRIIMKLLDGTTAEFGADPKKHLPGKLPPLEVLSLAGRALFFRFLVDRGVVLPAERSEICPSAGELRQAFATGKSAAETSAWLDETFNGDFLPLIDESIPSDQRGARQAAYEEYYRQVDRCTDGRIFVHLDAVLRGWESVDGRHVQPTFDFGQDWSDLNFAHIPVGVLSQVYENFSHRADARFAKSTSVHYTPRIIARFLVDEAFESLKDPVHAKVLDPACGAGIFLVLALRRLVKERWQHDQQAPNAATIRQILYDQVRGFDISESALRLAALGLYVTAIELNQSPRPPKSLRFPRNLRDTVLYNFNELKDQPDKRGRVPLGSLGKHVPSVFDKRFNLVIGNPPWTALKAPTPIGAAENVAKRKQSRAAGEVVEKDETTKLNEYFTGIGARALSTKAEMARVAKLMAQATALERLAANYENPRKNPDLPFLWRSTEWAVDGGTIAFVLPARLYLLGPKTETPNRGDDEGDEDPAQADGTDHNAWRAVMQGVAITGIINGSDLRKTGVWRGVDVPFSILFARNDLPKPRHAFRFVSPVYEILQNGRGRFRIDYQSDVLVTCQEVNDKPWLLKALALGSSLDVSLVERLLGAFPQTLGQFWAESMDLGEYRTGKGYDLSPGLAQKPAEFLGKLPVFERPSDFAIDYAALKTFKSTYGRESAYWPKTQLLFQAPLVIIPQSPQEDATSPKAFRSSKAVAFSQSNYGYSCNAHAEAEALAALIYLLPHSSVFTYFILLTCPRFGADRQTFLKQTLDSIPFPDPAKLAAEDRSRILDLARRLETAVNKPWNEIDALFAKLYKLSLADCELIADTLFSVAPYRTKGADAFLPPMPPDVEVFAEGLRETLQPLLAITGRTVVVQPADFEQDVYRDPWYFVEITTGQRVTVTRWLLEQVITIANDLGTSRVVVRADAEAGGLLLGQIAQRRWWTKSRARLCATHIIHNHFDALRPLRRKK